MEDFNNTNNMENNEVPTQPVSDYTQPENDYVQPDQIYNQFDEIGRAHV